METKRTLFLICLATVSTSSAVQSVCATLYKSNAHRSKESCFRQWRESKPMAGWPGPQKPEIHHRLFVWWHDECKWCRYIRLLWNKLLYSDACSALHTTSKSISRSPFLDTKGICPAMQLLRPQSNLISVLAGFWFGHLSQCLWMKNYVQLSQKRIFLQFLHVKGIVVILGQF